MTLHTYDPAEVTVGIGGAIMSGYTDGTFVEIARNEATWNSVVGADGIVTRGKTNNRSGTLTLTLKQSSPSNDILSALLVADELTNGSVFPVIVKDLSGNSLYFSAQAYITTFPSSTFSKDITDRSWVIFLADCDMFVGSNATT
jgi:hypothetical protein